jgi:hypothetical protein
MDALERAEALVGAGDYPHNGAARHLDADERVGAWVRLLRRRHVAASGCWEYDGTRTRPSVGYGRLKGLDGKNVCAHRLAWQLTYGRLEAHERVLHECDNPSCFRPQHLRAGSQRDNVDDMHAKGRDRKALGSAHARARLREDDVCEIRRRRAAGSQVCCRRSWRHI